MTWYNYGYFVRLPDRRIVPAGHDFGPTPDSYSVGDRKGIHGDVESFVIGILKGEFARMSGGYDVFVLLEEHRGRSKNELPPPWDFFQREEGRQFIEQLKRGPAMLVSNHRSKLI
jgi:hypothetical protein